MNDDITRMLSDAVPEAPDTAGWPAQIRRRDRRRKTGMAVGALAIIAVLGVPVGLLIADQFDPRIPANPASPIPTGPPPTGANPCEDLLELMRGGEDVTTGLPGGELPAGATRAWLCGDPQQPWAGPLEPLTSDADADLDELISAFNGYETLPPETACTDEYTMRYLTVFDYEETSVVVQGELHGCQVLIAHDDRRVGGEEFLELLTEQWLVQREHPRSAVTEADCGAVQGTLLPADPTRVISGFGCFLVADRAHDEPVPPDLLERIGNALASAVLEPVSYPEIVDDAVVLVDPWGATISLTRDGTGGFLVQNGTPVLYPQHRWEPDADLETEIIAYLGSPPSTGEPGIPRCFDYGDAAELPVAGVTSGSVCRIAEDGNPEGSELDEATTRELAAQAATSLESFGTESEGVPDGSFGTLVLARDDSTSYQFHRGIDGDFFIQSGEGALFRFVPEGEAADVLESWFGTE